MIKDLQAAFIDRDGTIGGTGNYVHPRDFKFYPFSKEALKMLKDKEIKVFSVTNQNRIALGDATEKEFVEQLLEYGLDDVYVCPHHIDGGCDCRKPKTGMFLKAAKKYNLDLTKCVVIGDAGDTDMKAAENIGAIKILVKTGYGEGFLKERREEWKEVEPDYIASDLLDAVKWLLKEE